VSYYYYATPVLNSNPIWESNNINKTNQIKEKKRRKKRKKSEEREGEMKAPSKIKKQHSMIIESLSFFFISLICFFFLNFSLYRSFGFYLLISNVGFYFISSQTNLHIRFLRRHLTRCLSIVRYLVTVRFSVSLLARSSSALINLIA
jgi:hypothetical protein